MRLPICAALAAIATLSGPALAANDMLLTRDTPARQSLPPPSPGLFQGTPEEQTACAPDAAKLCIEAIPDSLRVLACLQAHRKSLRRACLRVLESHGF